MITCVYNKLLIFYVTLQQSTFIRVKLPFVSLFRFSDFTKKNLVYDIRQAMSVRVIELTAICEEK